MLNRGKSHEHGWFRGTPIYGNPHMFQWYLDWYMFEVLPTYWWNDYKVLLDVDSTWICRKYVIACRKRPDTMHVHYIARSWMLSDTVDSNLKVLRIEGALHQSESMCAGSVVPMWLVVLHVTCPPSSDVIWKDFQYFSGLEKPWTIEKAVICQARMNQPYGLWKKERYSGTIVIIWYLNGIFPIQQHRGVLIQGWHYWRNGMSKKFEVWTQFFQFFFFPTNFDEIFHASWTSARKEVHSIILYTSNYLH